LKFIFEFPKWEIDQPRFPVLLPFLSFSLCQGVVGVPMLPMSELGAGKIHFVTSYTGIIRIIWTSSSGIFAAAHKSQTRCLLA
jgi:hypothetical protein